MRDVLGTMAAVSIVLLTISLSTRFASYLAEAASGKLDAGVLLTLMALRLPGYLELILPLGLFIGILLSYGRLYVESEMVVLSACGVSQGRLVVYTLYSSAIVAVIVAAFSLYIGPIGVSASDVLLAQQRNRTDFERVKPERFFIAKDNRSVIYAESVSDDSQRLKHVFMAQLPDEGNPEQELTIRTAESGEIVIDPMNQRKYLQLKTGSQYTGMPGEVNYQVFEYERLLLHQPSPDYALKLKKVTDGTSTLHLFQETSHQSQAALHWRFSLPVLVMILGLLAVPLSRTQPRQGRYTKILPAIIIYLLYLVALNAARGKMEEEGQEYAVALWGVHGMFLLLALLLLYWESLIRRLGKSR